MKGKLERKKKNNNRILKCLQVMDKKNFEQYTTQTPFHCYYNKRLIRFTR